MEKTGRGSYVSRFFLLRMSSKSGWTHFPCVCRPRCTTRTVGGGRVGEGEKKNRRARNFFLLQNFRTPLASTQSLTSWVMGFFPPGVKRPGYDADRSSQSEVKVWNWWSCTSTPPICLHGLDSDNFHFFLLQHHVGFCRCNIFADMRSPSCVHAMAAHQARL